MTATPEEALEAMAVHFDAANGDVVGTPYSGTVDGLRAALRAARDLGWRLVPEEMTDAMGHAFMATEVAEIIAGQDRVAIYPKRAWTAMLAAAPLLEEKP